MGSLSSKAAKTATGAARRQYPQRVPPQPSSNASSAPPPPAGRPSVPGPTVHPQTQASSTRDECTLLVPSIKGWANVVKPSTSTPPTPTLRALSVPSAPSNLPPPSHIAPPSPASHPLRPAARKARRTSPIRRSSLTLPKILP